MDWRILLVGLWLGTLAALVWVDFAPVAVDPPSTTFCPCPTKKESSRDEVHEYVSDQIRESLKRL